jgi:thymidine phosphorylase
MRARAAIISDIRDGRYSDIQLAAYVAASADQLLDTSETIAITRAMVDSGRRFDWDRTPVMDKHCVGGLPGNRTTPIVVPIVAACGLLMPKTSSRAITSPAGTADTMETMAPVNLSFERMRSGRGAGRSLHRVGRLGQPEPHRRYRDPGRARARPRQRGAAGRVGDFEKRWRPVPVTC